MDTWNLCPVALEEAIKDRIAKGKKPKAIIAVHLFGVPFQIEAVRAVACAYAIPILEDAAEAVGSSYKGKRCGTFVDIGVLSFSGNKIITTSGGGASVMPNISFKEKAIFFATQSREDAPHYQHNEIAYNYCMSNVCDGIGRGQIEVLDDHVRQRKAMHDFYVTVFKDVVGITVFTAPNGDNFANYWLSAILIDPEKACGMIKEKMRLALEFENIESRPLRKSMHLHPIFQQYPYCKKKVAETLFENGLCLRSGSNLDDEARARIRNVIVKLINT